MCDAIIYCARTAIRINKQNDKKMINEQMQFFLVLFLLQIQLLLVVGFLVFFIFFRQFVDVFVNLAPALARYFPVSTAFLMSFFTCVY